MTEKVPSQDDEQADWAAIRHSRFAQYRQIDSRLAKVIMEFAAPMLNHCTTYEARCEAVSYAVLCWNLALEEASERQEIERQIEWHYPEGQKEQILQLIDYLIKRKNELYADNRFYIIDYEIIRRGENMELRVTSKYLPRQGR